LAGKSFVGEGGQNPIEPAKLGCAILHGPHVANFIDVYALLDEAGGAAIVTDADDLAAILISLFADPGRLRQWLAPPPRRSKRRRGRRSG